MERLFKLSISPDFKHVRPFFVVIGDRGAVHYSLTFMQSHHTSDNNNQPVTGSYGFHYGPTVEAPEGSTFYDDCEFIGACHFSGGGSGVYMLNEIGQLNRDDGKGLNIDRIFSELEELYQYTFRGVD